MALVNDPSLNKSATNTIKSCVFIFEEHSFAEKLILVLDPFKKATTIVSAEKTQTLQKIMPLLVKIDQCMKDNHDDPPVIKKVKNIIRQQMASRTGGDTELTLMACVLNPFAKDLEFLSDEGRKFPHELLLKEAGGVNVETVNIKKEPADGQPEPEPPLPSLPVLEEMSDDVNKIVDKEEPPCSPPAKRRCPAPDTDEWLEDIMCVGERFLPKEDVIFQEVSRYLGTSHTDRQLTLLEWWNKNAQYFPRVSGLARKYLAIPASSVPSERVFSLAGHLVNKKRARRSPNNVDLVIFLRKNMELYW